MILRLVLLYTLLLILTEDSEAEETFTIMSMASRFPSASTSVTQDISDGSKAEIQQRFERMMGRSGKQRRKKKKQGWNKVMKPLNIKQLIRHGQRRKKTKTPQKDPPAVKKDPKNSKDPKNLKDPEKYLEEKKKYVRALIDVFTDLVMEVIEN